MQPTQAQVRSSLEALRTAPAEPMERLVPDEPIPEGMLEAVLAQSPVREDRLAEARRRIEAGEQPSNEALAERMVGRLVCDRLR